MLINLLWWGKAALITFIFGFGIANIIAILVSFLLLALGVL